MNTGDTQVRLSDESNGTLWVGSFAEFLEENEEQDAGVLRLLGSLGRVSVGGGAGPLMFLEVVSE